MKECLRHSHGYINIKDDYIYITKTGNWSEVKSLKEKNHDGFKKSDLMSKIKIGIFVVLLLSLVTIAVLWNIASGRISLVILIGLPVLAYFAYKYMIPEYGASFKIPIAKIKHIEINSNEVDLEFIDAKGERTSNIFSGMSDKGLEVMEKLRNFTENK